MRAAVLAVTGLALLLAAPAAADAKRWRGKTAQGRLVTVHTGGDGVVDRVRIKWKLRCRDSTRTGQTRFVSPLDSASTTSFGDAGTSHFNLGGGIRSRDTVSIRGTLGSGGRWHGTFKLRAVLRRSGKVVDRCRVGPMRWRARPV